MPFAFKVLYISPKISSLDDTMFERLTENAKADEDLLRLNDREGDTFDKAREVDFSFETSDRDRAEDFVEFVNSKSYGAAQFSEPETGQFHNHRLGYHADQSKCCQLDLGFYALP